jgi:hypothetical protein
MGEITGMSGIFIFVNTAPFIRPGRDEKNTVIGQYCPIPFAKYR